MFRPKSQQPSSDDLYAFLPEVKRSQLENSWAGVFRREILPMLWEVETDFADFYHLGMGSPNKPVAEILGTLILKDFHDYTDEQALEAVRFNMQWQYALQLGLSQASICQKTLHNFRDRMVKSQKHQHLFHQLTTKIITRFGLNTSRQRMDSTHIVGAMQQLTRLGLFVKTIEAFLFKLKRMAGRDEHVACAVEQLPKKFHERYLDREGYFSDTRSSLASRRLDACARDLWELLDRFRGDKTVSQLKQYRHMQRLFKEQCDLAPPPESEPDAPIDVNVAQTQKPACDPPRDRLDQRPMCNPSPADRSDQHSEESVAETGQDVQVALKEPKQIASTSLQNPSDEDATYGHKGKGYQFQLVETCVPTNPFQVITTTLLQGAHESDQKATIRLLETLSENGHKPKEAFADANYISGENILCAQAMGVDLLGPLPGDKPAPQALTLSDFTFDPTAHQILACPQGHAPVAHQDTRDQTGRSAYFDRTLCDLCPLSGSCPTHPNQTQRRLVWTPEKWATAIRRNEQETPAFKQAYKIRSGIEATISHEKNDHGLGRLRVRGRPAVELAATFKTLAMNVKRAVTYTLKTLKNAASPHTQTAKVVLAYIFRRKSRFWGLLKGFLKGLGSSQPILLLRH